MGGDELKAQEFCGRRRSEVKGSLDGIHKLKASLHLQAYKSLTTYIYRICVDVYIYHTSLVRMCVSHHA